MFKFFGQRRESYGPPSKVTLKREFIMLPIQCSAERDGGYKWETSEKVKLNINLEDITLESYPECACTGRLFHAILQRMAEHYGGIPLQLTFGYSTINGQSNFVMEVDFDRDFSLNLKTLTRSYILRVELNSLLSSKPGAILGSFSVVHWNHDFSYMSREDCFRSSSTALPENWGRLNEMQGLVQVGGTLVVSLTAEYPVRLFKSAYFLHRHAMYTIYTYKTLPHFMETCDESNDKVTLVSGMDSSARQFPRELLIGCSQVFATMFGERWCGDVPQSTVRVERIRRDVFSELYSFLHDGSIINVVSDFEHRGSGELAIEVLGFAHEYMIIELERRVTDFVYLLILANKLSCADDIVRLFVFYKSSGSSKLVLDGLGDLLRKRSQEALSCNAYEEMCWRMPRNADLVAGFLKLQAYMITSCTKLAVF